MQRITNTLCVFLFLTGESGNLNRNLFTIILWIISLKYHIFQEEQEEGTVMSVRKLMYVICILFLFMWGTSCDSEPTPPPSFTDSLMNPFGLAAVSDSASPTFVDIDGDGDFDAFIGDGNGDMIFYKNLGVKSSPAFDTPQTNPFGFINSQGFKDVVDHILLVALPGNRLDQRRQHHVADIGI